MRILFDFRSYQISKYRGIGRYILGLVEAMIRTEEVDISLVVSTKLEDIELDSDLIKKVNIYSLENFDNYEIDKLFDFFFIGDLFGNITLTSPNDVMPVKLLKLCRDIVGINYDLIPLVFAGNYLTNEEVVVNYGILLNYLNYASHIFCISNCTKNDSIKYLNRPESDFTVIYGGADESKFKSKNSNLEYNAKDRTNNIVFIAGIDRRKNYYGAARVFAKVYETGKIPCDAKLYLVCNTTNDFINDIKKALKGFKVQLGEQVIVTNYIPDDEVVELLSNARASIFPSFYEGLGLPIIESYIAGTPCFASNLSSTKEIVNEPSSFNPYDEEEFKDVIIKIYNDEDFCKQSLEWGRSIVKNFSWENSAKIVINKLKEIKHKNDNKPKSKKIAVFSVLPPEQTGIANYSYKTHLQEQEKYDVFCDINNCEDYNTLLDNGKVKNIFPLNLYDYVNFKENYQGKLFVLGNSHHHKEYIKQAIKTKGEPNRYLYLHETMIWGSFVGAGYFDIDFLKKWYPEHAKEIDITKFDLYNFGMENFVFGIRPIIHLSGIKNIIVNNERAKELILKELNDEERKCVKIHILFHPLDEIAADKIDLKENKYEYVIGTFGKPGITKLTDTVIDAVIDLNKENRKYKLVVAGYDVQEYLKDCNYDFIEKIENPESQYLYNLMNSVDLAVQLRPHPHGESSGCVAQLLSLGINILTSKGFVNEEMSKYCRTIEGVPAIKELANAIKDTCENPILYDNNDIKKKYSYKKLSEQLYDLILSEKK